jgi:hypothetical protein
MAGKTTFHSPRSLAWAVAVAEPSVTVTVSLGCAQPQIDQRHFLLENHVAGEHVGQSNFRFGRLKTGGARNNCCRQKNGSEDAWDSHSMLNILGFDRICQGLKSIGKFLRPHHRHESFLPVLCPEMGLRGRKWAK